MTFGRFLLVFCILATSLFAEIIILRDGRMMHVEVINGDERGIEVRRLDTDGRLFIRWALLRDEDKKSLRVRFGLQEDDSDADLQMEGHRVYVRRGDYYDGLIEEETQETLKLRRSGKITEFRRDAVRAVEERQVSVFDVYTPEELLKRRIAVLNPSDDDANAQFEMARWATKIGLYDEAILRYGKVQALDSSMKPDYIANQLERLEVLGRNKQIQGALSDADREARRNRFAACFGFLDAIMSADELDDQIKKEVTKRREKYEKKRWDYYRTLISREYHREVIKRINAMARSRDIRSRDEEKRVTIDKAMNYLRSTLHREIVAHFAEKYELNPKKEVERMWKERRKGPKRTASYNSGTFIVEGGGRGRGRANSSQGNLLGQAQRVAEALRGGRGGRGRNQPAANTQARAPKLIDKNEWWLAQDATIRSYWMRAYYAENARQFEIVSTSRRPCPHCGGQGSLKETGPQGAFVRVTCPRCQGTKSDKLVVYRRAPVKDPKQQAKGRKQSGPSRPQSGPFGGGGRPR